MDFSFSDEQVLLQQSISRFIQNEYSFESRQRNLLTDSGFSRANWSTFASLGWLGIPFDEADGGFGGGPIELMLMFQEFGRGLLIEPVLSSIVLAGGVLKLGATDVQKRKYLRGLIDGTLQAGLAFAEPTARYDLSDIETSAIKSGDNFCLNGNKTVVLNGPSADFLLVTARTSGEKVDRDGVSLFLIDSSLNGIERTDYPTIDGQRASEVRFQDVEIDQANLVGEWGQGLSILEEVIDEAILAVGSEAVGCMEVLYESTVDYCKTRKQFGSPIGSFQVLQHRMVDMFMEYEQVKSLMYLAAMQMSGGYNSETKKAISAFKVQVGKAGRFVGQNAVQLHGGMGMTEELKIGHYFKRLTMIDALFGNADFHLTRFGSF